MVRARFKATVRVRVRVSFTARVRAPTMSR